MTVTPGYRPAASLSAGSRIPHSRVDLTTVDVTTVDVTVVVPTRNEAGNIAELVRRVDDAFGSTCVEILFVDDSSDDTPATVVEVAAGASREVRLLHRAPAERVGGLGGAVAAGYAAARGRWIVVMDGDLQHPPHVAPLLVAAGAEHEVDVVVASRYTGEGAATGLDGASRRAVSTGAGRLARLAFPRRLAEVSDPMSGFFAVRRDALDLALLRPDGFKILLEVLARTPRLRVAEIAFTFAARHAGESKASLREGLRYLRHLTKLRAETTRWSLRRWHGTLARAVRFGAVGATGIAVNALAMWAFVAGAGAPYVVAAALATQASTTWNWVLTELFVFGGPKPGTARRRYLAFSLVNNAALLLRLPVLALLVSGLGIHYLLANVLTLAAAFGARFAVSDRAIYTNQGSTR